MTEPLSLGVIASSSRIARQAVIPAIEHSKSCVLAATASLSDPSATYSDYDELLADPGVAAVYVPLPNSLHRHWTERAARAGKHVLCEKPLAPSAVEAAAMAEACDEAGVVLMEAYMTPFHPRDERARRLVAEGELGSVLFATSAFTGVLEPPDDHRFRREMGGGALLDLGIYCVSPLLWAFGFDASEHDAVREASGRAHRGPLGVDASFSGFLDFGEGRTGAFRCSFEAPARQLLEIVGTDASLSLEQAFSGGHHDRTLVLSHRDGTRTVIESEGADPYLRMVEHFAAVVAGEEAMRRPVTEAVGLQRILDRLAWTAAPASS